MRPALSEALFPLSSLDGLCPDQTRLPACFLLNQPDDVVLLQSLLLLAVLCSDPAGLLGVRSLMLSDSWLMFLVSKEGLVVIRRLEFRCVFKT